MEIKIYDRMKLRGQNLYLNQNSFNIMILTIFIISLPPKSMCCVHLRISTPSLKISFNLIYHPSSRVVFHDHVYTISNYTCIENFKFKQQN